MVDQTVELLPWQRWVKRIAMLCLTLLMAWLLAKVFWLLVAPEPIRLPAISGAKQSQVGVTASSAPFAIFGEPGAEVVAQPKRQTNAPVTRLRLELLGVNHSSVDQLSSAIIAPKGGKGEYYRLGDVVQGRTKLSGVYADRVILDNAGKLETLKFDETKSASRGVQRTAPRSTSNALAESDQDKVSLLKNRFRQVRSPEEFVSIAGSVAMEEPELVLSSLGLNPEGSGQGYSVKSGSILLKAGMQRGDKLLSINGQRLGDTSADKVLFEQVLGSGRAQIEVQRGNKRFTINQSIGAYD